MQRNLSAVSQYACVVSEEIDRVRTYDLDAMQLRLIASVNVIDTKARQISQVDVADEPAAKTFFLRHQSCPHMSSPEPHDTTRTLPAKVTPECYNTSQTQRRLVNGYPIWTQATDMGKCLLIKFILLLFTRWIQRESKAKH